MDYEYHLPSVRTCQGGTRDVESISSSYEYGGRRTSIIFILCVAFPAPLFHSSGQARAPTTFHVGKEGAMNPLTQIKNTQKATLSEVRNVLF